MYALAALIFQSAAKEVGDGRCPYMPGEIPSKVSKEFDLKLLEGNWINVFDEREMSDNFLCLSARFTVDPEYPYLVAFDQANSIYEVTRQALRDQGDEASLKQANQKYFVISGRYFAFEQFDKAEKSSAAITTYDQLTAEKIEDRYDFSTFH